MLRIANRWATGTLRGPGELRSFDRTAAARRTQLCVERSVASEGRTRLCHREPQLRADKAAQPGRRVRPGPSRSRVRRTIVSTSHAGASPVRVTAGSQFSSRSSAAELCWTERECSCADIPIATAQDPWQPARDQQPAQRRARPGRGPKRLGLPLRQASAEDQEQPRRQSVLRSRARFVLRHPAGPIRLAWPSPASGLRSASTGRATWRPAIGRR